MAKFDKAGISLELDTSDFDAGYKSVLADAGKLDALAPTVKVNVDDSEIGTASASLLDLEKDASLKVNVDDSELTVAKGLANDLNADTSTKANVDSSELDTALETLKNIQNLATIDVVLSLTEQAAGVIETIKGLPGIGSVLSADNASAILTAGGGGNTIEELAIAQDLYANNMVASVEEGALLLNQLKAMGVTGLDNLEAAANGAVNVQQSFLAVGQEADASTIALAQNQLVISGLAKDYTEASDIIASGVGEGANQGDDFLDTIIEYANNFANAGANAQEFLSIVNTGLDSGLGNTDRVADLFRETTLRGLNPDETAAQDALKSIGLGDETAAMQAGEITGAAWFQSVIDTIKAEENAGKQQTLAADIFGTQAEDQTVAGVLGIDTVDAAFDKIEGRAAEVSTLLNDTISNGATELLNTIDLAIGDLLSSDSLNLDQKLEDIKKAVQTTVDEIQAGNSIGEAIEIGFGVEGIDEGLGNIQRVFGQMYLSLLEVVAFIQDPTGQTDNDKLTRGRLATGAAAQLPFDLLLANPDEVEGLLKQAVSRGVTDLAPSLTTALDEAIAAGDFDQVATILQGVLATAELPPEAATALVNNYIAKVDEAMAALPPNPADIAADAMLTFDPAAFDTAVANFNTGMETAIAAENPSAEALWASLWTVPEEVNTSFTDLGTDVDTAMTNANLVTGLATQSMIDAFSQITDGVTTADEEIAMAITGNTMTASFDAMAASADLNVEATKASFQGLLATVSEVDARMSGFFNGIMAKVSAVTSAIEGIGTVPTGGGGGNSTTIINNNSQTNNVQSNAQAAQASYGLATVMRGQAP